MKPAQTLITFVIDGREVTAPEGEMLVDAARRGDIDIPVFCYEPKLGGPVGACRMCLVEIEGMPKLQPGCATGVRDGMVVYTSSREATEGQNAVVEFLLANHPLDCPVCDKGGECPLQDISMGWGRGRSRFQEPKRHFQKPLPLSPLIAIDRERCILCYRCVRFSQDVSQDQQLQLLDRSSETYVGTFNERPYVAPFHGNITELCPVGALTSRPYRFRARPWDIEDAATVCTLCPSQCNVKLTVRDERVERVMARDNPAVDDGWLCDKGRWGYEMIHSPDRITAPQVGGDDTTWQDALERAAKGLQAAGAKTAALVGGRASNEEGYLVQKLVRDVLGGTDVDSRRAGKVERDAVLALSRPELQAAVIDVDWAGAILVLDADPMHAAPVMDLRIRKAIRENGAKLCVATARPTPLDGGAEAAARYAPGAGPEFVAALAGALGIDGYDADGDSPYADDADEIAGILREADDAVIVWGENLTWGPDSTDAVRALVAIAEHLGLHDKPECGLLELPVETNARGLREVGCLPGVGPGLTDIGTGRNAAEIREALIDGELDAIVLFDTDPIRDLPRGDRWAEALRQARFVLSVSAFATGSASAADVVLPAETHAEKDGTVTHFEGRLQRLRPGIPHQGDARMGWQWLVELSARLGTETGLHTGPMVLAELAGKVPFYKGLTHDEIGGRGLRWLDRDPATAYPAPSEQWKDPEPDDDRSDDGDATHAAGGAIGGRPQPPADEDLTPAGPAVRSSEQLAEAQDIVVGTWRDLWATEVTERNQPLMFLTAQQRLELSPADAEQLGVVGGDEVEVTSNGTTVNALVMVRERMRPGAAFMVAGTATDNANAFEDAEPQRVSVRRRVAVEAA
ncbi:MAG: NADH-quinone oxidoreductase subunit NuoG [Solirubrobacterales bacterium]